MKRVECSVSSSRYGFSLVELMVSVGIASIVALATGASIVNVVKSQTASNVSATKNQLIKDVRNEFAADMINPATAANGCAGSIFLDTNSGATPVGTLLTNLAGGQCVPALIKLTHTGNKELSGLVSNLVQQQSAMADATINNILYCNAVQIATSANTATYAGELYMTASADVTGAVLGPAYGARQFVSRLLLQFDKTTGAVLQCNAPYTPSVNAKVCTSMLGYKYDPTTNTCRSKMNVTTTAQTMCTPGVSLQQQWNGTSAPTCKPVNSLCSSTTTAGAFTDGKLDCNMPRSIPASTTAIPFKIVPIPAQPGATSDSNSALLQAGVQAPPGGLPNVGSSSANATVATVASLAPTSPATAAISPTCQTALENYLACMAAQLNLVTACSTIASLGTTSCSSAGVGNCSALASAVCDNTPSAVGAVAAATTVPVTTTAPTGASVPTSVPIASGTGLQCSCGATAINPGAFCGYCLLLNNDPGYGMTNNATKVEQCDPGGSGLLQPVSNYAIASGTPDCSAGTNAGRAPAISISGSIYYLQ